MGNIVLLDELTINQIAAGEVVERPASVIKEMVENSIDAGATSINIEIKNGGISYIRIADNGKGVKADDMELAFERHATSKIRSAEDLATVTSMGFRGEALASIAAISKVEMVSKTAEDTIGNKIVVEGGNVLEKEEAGCGKGTTITVQNLFYNTPVRYKFLKKDYTESGYIEEAITRLALVNPYIAFKLVNTGKTIIQTNGNGNIQDVIYAIYGKDIATGVLEVDYNYEDIHITGVVGKPEIARSNRSNQIFFVNKRYVKDKTLSGAAENSFKGLLPIGKYGFMILNLEMSPSKVDVNVHPAKLEVRFQEESKVFKAVYHAIKDTLLKTELVANAEKQVFTQDNIKEEFIREDNITPKKTNEIANLFRKISGNQEQETRVEEMPEEKINEDTPKAEKLEIFEKLMEMQRKIKSEVENDPSLHTNVEELIKNTASLQENFGKDANESKQDLQPMSTNLELNEEKEEAEEIVENVEKLIEQNEEIEVQGMQDKVEEYIKNDIELQNVTKEEKAEEVASEVIEEPKQDEDQQENIVTEETVKIDDIKTKLSELENIGEASPEFVDMYTKTFGKLPATAIAKQEEEEKKINAYDIIQNNNISVFEDIEEYNKPQYKFIGIVFRTYIILEIGSEMYILDQHAAHERIMYEKVKANYYSRRR